MNSRLLTAGAVASCLTVVVAAERYVDSVARPRLVASAEAGAAAITDPRPPSVSPDPEIAKAPQSTITSSAADESADKAPPAEPLKATDRVASAEVQSPVEAARTDTSQTPPPPTQPVQVATAMTSDPVLTEPNTATSKAIASTVNGTIDSIEILDECPAVDVCIDRYLWALYDRTPKEDTIKVPERRKVKVKKKSGKIVTVTKTFTRLVDENFAWKDPKAAAKAGMSMADYVIGGMERSFKAKLFNILHAADQAGLSPGITSAFRDDYRQSIASGLKAASDRSYHGGSFRGGYGHGVAADIVSVKGLTRNERWIASDALWKWVDEHGREFGIARPYLDRDPPHLAPIDGKEYADHRGTKTKTASVEPNKKTKAASAEPKKKTKAASADAKKKSKAMAKL